MGLRCIIGHEYGEPQTSRDRRQRGNEVVVTVQEYRECARCGHRRIISENKEVTAEPPAEPTDEPSDSDTTADSPDPEDEGPSVPEPIDEPLSAEEDDGIILEDEPEVTVRAYGEWPEADRGEEPSDAGVDHDPWPGEAVEASDPPEPADAASESFGAEPPRPSEDTAEGGPDSMPEDVDAEVTHAVEAAGNTTPTPPPDPRDIELVCPDCSDTWPSMNASLRPGDICPECRGGYLQEQVVQ